FHWNGSRLCGIEPAPARRASPTRSSPLRPRWPTSRRWPSAGPTRPGCKEARPFCCADGTPPLSAARSTARHRACSWPLPRSTTAKSSPSAYSTWPASLAAPAAKNHMKGHTMSLAAGRKAEIIKNYATTTGDTGSPEVQVAILSERITSLTEHFKTHVNDNHSRRGLLKLVSQRRQLLDYLKRADEGRYKTLIERLGIRRG